MRNLDPETLHTCRAIARGALWGLIAWSLLVGIGAIAAALGGILL